MRRAGLLMLCGWLLCGALPGHAQDTAEPPPGTEQVQPTEDTLPWPPREDADPAEKRVIGMDRTASYFDMMGSLMVVLGLIVLLAWLARKYLPKTLTGMGDGRQLRLIQSLPLGPRRYVSLIEADGRRYLLGVTDSQINLIKALDEMPFEQALQGMDEPRKLADMLAEDAE